MHPQEARNGSSCGESATDCPPDAKQRQRLERLSHELRTPLNAIDGFTQLLQHDLAPHLSSIATQRLDAVRQATAHAVAVLDRFFTITPATPSAQAKPGVDVARQVQESLAMLEADRAQAAVRPTLLAALPRTPVLAAVDATSLRQVLLNLLTNAVKYNRPGGDVKVKVWQQAQIAHVQVQDSGIGMSADQLDHVFEPYNRLGRETGPVPGTGLGLTLVRELVEAMGGDIEIFSAPNDGTRVHLKLPAVSLG